MFNVAIDQLLARLCAPAQSFPPECVLAVQFIPVLLDCLAHLQARPVSIIHPTILRRLTFVLLLHARLFRVTHPSPPDLPAQPSICVGNCVLFSFTFILSLATGRFLACHFFYFSIHTPWLFTFEPASEPPKWLSPNNSLRLHTLVNLQIHASRRTAVRPKS